MGQFPTGVSVKFNPALTLLVLLIINIGLLCTIFPNLYGTVLIFFGVTLYAISREIEFLQSNYFYILLLPNIFYIILNLHSYNTPFFNYILSFCIIFFNIYIKNPTNL